MYVGGLCHQSTVSWAQTRAIALDRHLHKFKASKSGDRERYEAPHRRTLDLKIVKGTVG